MHYVYIIYSKDKDTFYIGETSDIENRIKWHNTAEFDNAYTKISDDWEVVYSIPCNNISQARKIEQHIKSMKSKKYIHSLITYPEISQKLIQKYT
jgi:putative endonuclease